MTGRVTALGIRDGDPAVLRALIARRGSAVLAYCERACAPAQVPQAAADAFARFRALVVAAPKPAELDPEAALLSCTRHATAERAPRGQPAPAGQGIGRLLGGRSLADQVGLVPELLIARADGTLGADGEQQLDRLLDGSAAARAAEERFRTAERAYHSAPSRAIPPEIVDHIVEAMAAVPAPGAGVEEPQLVASGHVGGAVSMGAAGASGPPPVPPEPPRVATPEPAAPREAEAAAIPEPEAAPPSKPPPEREAAPPSKPPPESEAPAPSAPPPESEAAAPSAPPPEREAAPPGEPPPEREAAAPSAPPPDDEAPAPVASEAVPPPDDEAPPIAQDEPAAPTSDEAAATAEAARAAVAPQPHEPEDAAPPRERRPSEPPDDANAEAPSQRWDVPPEQPGPDETLDVEIAAARLRPGDREPAGATPPGRTPSDAGEQPLGTKPRTTARVPRPTRGSAAAPPPPPPPQSPRTSGRPSLPGRSALAPAAAVVAIAAVSILATSGVLGGDEAQPPVDTGVAPKRTQVEVPEGEAAAVIDELRRSADRARRQRLADTQSAPPAAPAEETPPPAATDEPVAPEQEDTPAPAQPQGGADEETPQDAAPPEDPAPGDAGDAGEEPADAGGTPPEDQP